MPAIGRQRWTCTLSRALAVPWDVQVSKKVDLIRVGSIHLEQLLHRQLKGRVVSVFVPLVCRHNRPLIQRLDCRSRLCWFTAAFKIERWEVTYAVVVSVH